MTVIQINRDVSLLLHDDMNYTMVHFLNTVGNGFFTSRVLI